LKEVWIGLTQVTKADGCRMDFWDGAGAFVWWATQADSEEEFLRKLKKTLEYYSLVLFEVEQVRRFADSQENSEELCEMVERAMENDDWTLYGTFHTFSPP
jgi:hypothetical protein